MSAQHLKKADAQRARPRSAVVKTAIKGDRPMKYETTRPISAKTQSKSGKTDGMGIKNRMANPIKDTKDGYKDDYSLDITGNGEEEEENKTWNKGPISMEDSLT